MCWFNSPCLTKTDIHQVNNLKEKKKVTNTVFSCQKIIKIFPVTTCRTGDTVHSIFQDLLFCWDVWLDYTHWIPLSTILVRNWFLLVFCFNMGEYCKCNLHWPWARRCPCMVISCLVAACSATGKIQKNIKKCFSCGETRWFFY
jgi:hypothetical protein